MDASVEFATLVANLVELEFSDIYGFESLIDLSKVNPQRRSRVIHLYNETSLAARYLIQSHPFRRAEELIILGIVEIDSNEPICGTLKIAVGSPEAEGHLGEVRKWKSRRLLCGNAGSFQLRQPDYCSTSSEYLYINILESQINAQISRSYLASSRGRHSRWHRQQYLLLSLALP